MADLIRNERNLRLARVFSWGALRDISPRGIYPSDVDGIVECNSRFAIFEMKTLGEEMKRGQELLLDRLIYSLRGRSVLFLIEHDHLERVTLPDGVIRFRCRMFHKSGAGRETGLIGGEHFPSVYSAFFDWAENREPGRLAKIIGSTGQEPRDIEAPEPGDHEEWIREYDAGWEKHWRAIP